MARISLRAYNHEIENLIDRGQIEEAIAHCKNIIKQFPKHIETYRLLGKAYLESQRYAEAADILQRVLSVFPDDFVSQLGMSIIREDEGNLDAAIWHMERAYEVQPFNRAVQDELRRLYGRRDGVEPPRIRLTRGALVRMYARGDLYPQAIAEIRAALAEDQKRVDLLALLSRMYYLSGQKIEATEICTSLIGKLPYCYEANRILKDILPETSRAEDARIFQQRLFSLDPYAAFVSPNAPTSSQVPEQTVMVEKVDWQPNMPDTQSPDWARTIGVRWEDSPEEALPDWLNTISPGEGLQTPVAGIETEELAEPATSTGEDLIPDFLKDAGWQPSDGSAESTSLNTLEEPTAVSEEDLAEAEIPDWLKTLAPENMPVADQTETEDSASLDWLAGILPAAEGTPAAEIASIESPIETEIPLAAQPTTGQDEVELKPAEPEMVSDSQGTTESTDIPGWLDNLQTPAVDVQVPVDGEISGEREVTPESAETPDWLNSLHTPAVDEPIPAEVPGWLETLQTPAADEQMPVEDELPAVPQETPETAEIPEWLNTLQTPSIDEHVAADEELPSSLMEAAEASSPDWIQQAQDEMPTEVEPEAAPPAEVPDWLKELSTDEVPVESAAPEAAIAEISASAVDATSTETTVPSTPPTSMDEMDLDSAMAWMEALAAKQGADEDLLKITAPEQRSEVAPDWIQRQAEPVSDDIEQEQSFQAAPELMTDLVSQPETILEDTAQVEEAQTVTPLDMTDQTTEVPAETNDLDAAMAWMEALAAKQGADEDTLKITTPESRSETPPDWVLQQAQEEGLPEEVIPGPVNEIGEETVGIVSTEPELTYTAEPDGVVTSLLPDLDHENEIVSKPLEASADMAAGVEIPTVPGDSEKQSPPTWITELTNEPVLEEPASSQVEVGQVDEFAIPRVDASVSPAEDLIPEVEIQEPAAESATPAVDTADIPDWLRSYEEEQQHQEPVWQPDASFSPEAVTDDQLPDWLAAEAEPAPSPEIEQPEPTAFSPAQTAELPGEPEMPDWLKQLQGSSPENAAETAAPAVESNWVPEYQPASSQPAPASTPSEHPIPAGEALALARASLRSGDLDQAVTAYNDCINSGNQVEDVISDLKAALDQHPVDIGLWQALGDAYMRQDHIQDALDAYTKAEELLR